MDDRGRPCGSTAVTAKPLRTSECLGELVQIDGSEHAWFEDRGQRCTLLAFVDDATSRLMQLPFTASESAFDYFRATRAYLEAHGKPVATFLGRKKEQIATCSDIFLSRVGRLKAGGKLTGRISDFSNRERQNV
jgi:hypothetical protein